MDVLNKLQILADAAKYDVACTSSGTARRRKKGSLGTAVAAGICHSFSADGRCISLLKVLMTNYCVYDCCYCINRCSNDIPRAAFQPRELADLTIEFYRRNYIEGLFLSSAIIKNPDYTCEKMIQILALLRGEKYRFNGYIHVKAIPGADPTLLEQMGYYADRVSINIELPSEDGLKKLAPDKTKKAILKPMRLIKNKITENKEALVHYRNAPVFAPAGQSTQMIIGATDDSDYQILNLTESLYQKYALKRVFYSAYVPVVENTLLPAIGTKPPLLREHRLYQADWLLRFYGFHAEELLDEETPNFHPLLDPKCSWALAHLDYFPVEVTTAPKEALLRIPGIGVKSTLRIIDIRRQYRLNYDILKKAGVVLKRAHYFITCNGKRLKEEKVSRHHVIENLISEKDKKRIDWQNNHQLSFLETSPLFKQEILKWLME